LLALFSLPGNAQQLQCPVGTSPVRLSSGETMCRCPNGSLVTLQQVCASAIGRPVLPEAAPIPPPQLTPPVPALPPTNPVPVPSPGGGIGT
jgi:hypothetical protein